jgi:hypothetical protein
LANASDDFNRALGGLGSNWVGTSAGGVGIINSSGQTCGGLGLLYEQRFISVTPATPDQFSELEFVARPPTDFCAMNVMVRHVGTVTGGGGGSDNRCGYSGQLLHNTNDTYAWSIYRIDNGVETTKATGSTTATAGDKFRIQVIGNALAFKKNGTTLGTASDSVYSGVVGGWGFALYEDATAEQWIFDNWLAGDIASAAVYVPTPMTQFNRRYSGRRSRRRETV